MQRLIVYLGLMVFVLSFVNYTKAQINDENQKAIDRTQQIINEIAQKSYPEIKLKKIKIKTFSSNSNFFKARVSYTRFLTFQKMRHIVYVNPKVFQLNAPLEGIRAILAHELAHVLYYTEKNRLELLGLVRLTSESFITKFERKADLEAIQRGYGEGLIEYRKWLYQNIPQNNVESKKRDYFSPEEIELILEITKEKPKMFDSWQKKVPKNLYEIKKSIE